MPASTFARPAVDGDRVYYVSNRGELVCLDLQGQRNGKKDASVRTADAKVIWKLDMVRELGVFKRDWGDVCSPLPGAIVVGDLVYALTGNGVDGPGEVPRPNAPSMVAVNKATGTVVWSTNLAGKEILFSSWSTPVWACVNGRDQVILPGGDGRLYGFEPRSGALLWRFDCNPKGATRPTPQNRGTADYFVGAPTVDGHRLYTALAKAPELGLEPRRPLMAIDLTRVKDSPEKAKLWEFRDPEFGGLYAPVTVSDGIVYAYSASNVLFALDAATGQELWRSGLNGGDVITGFLTPCVHEGKVYLGGEDSVIVFRAGRIKKCVGLYELPEPTEVPVVADKKTLYVSTRRGLWALKAVDD